MSSFARLAVRAAAKFVIAFVAVGIRAAQAEATIIDMLDGERIVVSSAFPLKSNVGNEYYISVSPYDTHVRQRRLIPLRELRSIDRGRYLRENNLTNRPCGFDWELRLNSDATVLRVFANLYVLELPPNAEALSVSEHLQLISTGPQSSGMLARYGGTILNLECERRPNVDSGGIPVLRYDVTSGKTQAMRLNFSRVAQLRRIDITDLPAALSSLPPYVPQAGTKVEDVKNAPRIAAQASSQSAALESQRDKSGRRLIAGPVGPGVYYNVRIISNTVGVHGPGPITVIDSEIEAPICVVSIGIGTRLQNNILRCDLCVQFQGQTLLDNALIGNQCSGRLTNRPDVFGK